MKTTGKSLRNMSGLIKMRSKLSCRYFVKSSLHLRLFMLRINFQTSGDPFLAMINNYTQRGGSPEEFVQALFSVSRDISLNKFSNVTPPSSSTGSVSPTNSASGSHQNQNGSPFHKFANYWHSGSKRPRREDESQEDEEDEGKLQINC